MKEGYLTLLEDDEAKVFEPNNGCIRIGSNPTCDIYLKGEPLQFCFVASSTNHDIMRSTQDPFFLNDIETHNEHILTHNDVIRIANYTLVYKQRNKLLNVIIPNSEPTKAKIDRKMDSELPTRKTINPQLAMFEIARGEDVQSVAEVATDDSLVDNTKENKIANIPIESTLEKKLKDDIHTIEETVSEIERNTSIDVAPEGDLPDAQILIPTIGVFPLEIVDLPQTEDIQQTEDLVPETVEQQTDDMLLKAAQISQTEDLPPQAELSQIEAVCQHTEKMLPQNENELQQAKDDHKSIEIIPNGDNVRHKSVEYLPMITDDVSHSAQNDVVESKGASIALEAVEPVLETGFSIEKIESSVAEEVLTEAVESDTVEEINQTIGIDAETSLFSDLSNNDDTSVVEADMSLNIKDDANIEIQEKAAVVVEKIEEKTAVVVEKIEEKATVLDGVSENVTVADMTDLPNMDTVEVTKEIEKDVTIDLKDAEGDSLSKIDKYQSVEINADDTPAHATLIKYNINDPNTDVTMKHATTTDESSFNISTNKTHVREPDQHTSADVHAPESGGKQIPLKESVTKEVGHACPDDDNSSDSNALVIDDKEGAENSPCAALQVAEANDRATIDENSGMSIFENETPHIENKSGVPLNNVAESINDGPVVLEAIGPLEEAMASIHGERVVEQIELTPIAVVYNGGDNDDEPVAQTTIPLEKTPEKVLVSSEQSSSSSTFDTQELITPIKEEKIMEEASVVESSKPIGKSPLKHSPKKEEPTPNMTKETQEITQQSPLIEEAADGVSSKTTGKSPLKQSPKEKLTKSSVLSPKKLEIVVTKNLVTKKLELISKESAILLNKAKEVQQVVTPIKEITQQSSPMKEAAVGVSSKITDKSLLKQSPKEKLAKLLVLSKKKLEGDVTTKIVVIATKKEVISKKPQVLQDEAKEAQELIPPIKEKGITQQSSLMKETAVDGSSKITGKSPLKQSPKEKLTKSSVLSPKKLEIEVTLKKLEESPRNHASDEKSEPNDSKGGKQQNNPEPKASTSKDALDELSSSKEDESSDEDDELESYEGDSGEEEDDAEQSDTRDGDDSPVQFVPRVSGRMRLAPPKFREYSLITYDQTDAEIAEQAREQARNRTPNNSRPRTRKPRVPKEKTIRGVETLPPGVFVPREEDDQLEAARNELSAKKQVRQYPGASGSPAKPQPKPELDETPAEEPKKTGKAKKANSKKNQKLETPSDNDPAEDDSSAIDTAVVERPIIVTGDNESGRITEGDNIAMQPVKRSRRKAAHVKMTYYDSDNEEKLQQKTPAKKARAKAQPAAALDNSTEPVPSTSSVKRGRRANARTATVTFEMDKLDKEKEEVALPTAVKRGRRKAQVVRLIEENDSDGVVPTPPKKGRSKTMTGNTNEEVDPLMIAATISPRILEATAPDYDKVETLKPKKAAAAKKDGTVAAKRGRRKASEIADCKGASPVHVVLVAAAKRTTRRQASLAQEGSNSAIADGKESSPPSAIVGGKRGRVPKEMPLIEEEKKTGNDEKPDKEIAPPPKKRGRKAVAVPQEEIKAPETQPPVRRTTRKRVAKVL